MNAGGSCLSAVVCSVAGKVSLTGRVDMVSVCVRVFVVDLAFGFAYYCNPLKYMVVIYH